MVRAIVQGGSPGHGWAVHKRLNRSRCRLERMDILREHLPALCNVPKTNSPKYTTLHLTSPTLLEIMALSLTNILPSLTKLHLSPKSATITFASFAVSGLTLIRQLPVPLLLLSFTPNLTTVILCPINSLSLNYPVSSRSRTLLLVLSLKLLSPAISLPSYALSTGSESVNAHPIPRSSTSFPRTAYTDLCLHRFFLPNRFLFFVFLIFCFCAVR